jgi:hypothetical protein
MAHVAPILRVLPVAYANPFGSDRCVSTILDLFAECQDFQPECSRPARLAMCMISIKQAQFKHKFIQFLTFLLYFCEGQFYNENACSYR